MNLITKKMKEVTKEEFIKWKISNCCTGKLSCQDCPFDKVMCGRDTRDSWVVNKDLYSDKFLDQIITVEVPLLDDEEKKYLSAVIKPFRHKIAYIVKMLVPFKDREKIVIYYRNCYNVMECIELPDFKSELMYKNMRIAQLYKIEDLGL